MIVDIKGRIQRVHAHSRAPNSAFTFEIVVPEGIFKTNGAMHLKLNDVVIQDLQKHFKIAKEGIFKLSGKRIDILIRD